MPITGLHAGETTWAALTAAADSDAASPTSAASAVDPVAQVDAVINANLPAGSDPLTVRGLELHLIEGLNTVDVGQGPTVVVAFPPEWLFVADVGLAARAGVSVLWQAGQAFGDPDFPDFGRARFRSVSGAGPASLIYPAVAGELVLTVDPTSVPPAADPAWTRAGFRDVRITGSFGEARCLPYREADACRAAMGLPGVRSAEPNRVVRLIDISPGWKVTRIV